MNTTNIPYSFIDENGKMVRVHPLDEALDAIRYRMIRIQEQNEKLVAENAKLKSGEWATEQMKKTLEDAERIRAEYKHGFPMTEKEVLNAEKFIREHSASVHNYDSKTAIGGQYTYEFTPTSIGVFSSVRCCTCGATHNITDYDLI